MLTLAIAGPSSMNDPANFFVKEWKIVLALSLSCLLMVKLMSLVFKDVNLSDCTIVSKIKLFSARAKHIEAATPGLSGRFRMLT